MPPAADGSFEVRSGKVSQVERVDGEMCHHRAAEIARPQKELTKHRPSDKRCQGPGQKPHLGPDGQKSKDRTRSPKADNRLKSPAKENLLADGRGDGQHQDLGAMQGAKQCAQVAVQGPPPLESVRGIARREDETKSDQQASHYAEQDLWVFSAADTPHTRIPAQGRPGDPSGGQGEIQDENEGRPRPTSTDIGHRTHHSSKVVERAECEKGSERNAPRGVYCKWRVALMVDVRSSCPLQRSGPGEAFKSLPPTIRSHEKWACRSFCPAESAT